MFCFQGINCIDPFDNFSCFATTHTGPQPGFRLALSVSTSKSCAMLLEKSIFQPMLQNDVAPNISQKLSSSQWTIILHAPVYTTYHGKQVLVIIRFNDTFLLLKPYFVVKPYVPFS